MPALRSPPTVDDPRPALIAPAQIARLPVCIAAFTTIGPPVTSSRRVNSFLQSALNESSDGFSMMHAMFSMPVSR